MIAYNPQWLDGLTIRRQANQWFGAGFIRNEQWNAVQTQFPVNFYTPNFFIRVGLFTFCWVLVASVFGLIGIGLIDVLKDSETGVGVVCLLFSGSTFAALEFVIREKKHYRSGIDDALLHLGLILAITGISFVFSSVLHHSVWYFLLALPLLVAATIRYTDTAVAVASYGCLAGIFWLLLTSNPFTTRLIPFAGMLFAAGTYFGGQRYQEREALRFWEDCFFMLKASSLLLFYASGNYFVVDEIGKMLLPGYSVPLSGLFWLFTAAIPVGYVYTGLKKKDRLLLQVGLLVTALALITFNYYFIEGYNEMVLTTTGLVLVAGAYWCIRLLKQPAFGLTYEKNESLSEPVIDNAGAAILAQTLSPDVPEPGVKFGGGQFGGGGAGGNY